MVTYAFSTSCKNLFAVYPAARLATLLIVSVLGSAFLCLTGFLEASKHDTSRVKYILSPLSYQANISPQSRSNHVAQGSDTLPTNGTINRGLPAHENKSMAAKTASKRSANNISAEELRHMMDTMHKLSYFPKQNVMLMVTAKMGSTNTLLRLYTAASGHRWNHTTCSTIHRRESPCWHGYEVAVPTLAEAEQRRILTSKDVLRVAIQRDPYERLLSAFKSKYTCEGKRFNTHVVDRGVIVPRLRRHVRWPVGRPCMSISEFARALDELRKNVGRTPGYPKSMRSVDNHIRPQQYFFDVIDYDVVLDVADLSDKRKLAVFLNRFPFDSEVAVRKKFGSGKEVLVVPEEAEQSIRAFAALSKTGPSKYVFED